MCGDESDELCGAMTDFVRETDAENENDFGFDEMNEVECPACFFDGAMHHVERCWECFCNSLVFCPKCRRITCLGSRTHMGEIR